MKVVFDCPLKNNCFRHKAKELCSEKMIVNVTNKGCWVSEQPFCDHKPSRNDLLNGSPEYHDLFRFFRL